MKRKSALRKYEIEWRRCRKTKRLKKEKEMLKKALEYCRVLRRGEPAWLRDAFCRLGRQLILRMKESGRRTDLLTDDPIYATVEDYLECGMTQGEAFHETAKDYKLIVKRGENKGEFADLTVRSIWLRHRKRIVKVDPATFCLGWRFKKEYVKTDKNAALATEVPAYLRTKN